MHNVTIKSKRTPKNFPILIILFLIFYISLTFASIEEKEIPVIEANKERPMNSSADTLPIIGDSGYVYQEKWPDDLDVWPYSWQLMALHSAKSKQEYLIEPVNANLEIIQFQGDSWRHISRIQYPNNRVSYEYNLWTTGDIDGDSSDEIITCSDSFVSIYKWNGQDFMIRTTTFRYCVEQVRVGDINNDGNNELVFLGGDSLPKDVIGYPYHLCITKWDTSGLHMLWDDSTKLGYGVRNMPDFLLPIADVTNRGYNQMLISRSQSDVSPTEYNLLEWNDKKKHLELIKSCRITDQLVPGDSHILSLPFISGMLNCLTKDDTTFLSGMFFSRGQRYLQNSYVILKIKNDTLVQMRPIFWNLVQSCFIDIDGNGVGLLVLWRESPSTERQFRFYRL